MKYITKTVVVTFLLWHNMKNIITAAKMKYKFFGCEKIRMKNMKRNCFVENVCFVLWKQMRMNFLCWNKAERDIEQIEWEKKKGKKDHLQNKLKQMCWDIFFYIRHFHAECKPTNVITLLPHNLITLTE